MTVVSCSLLIVSWFIAPDVVDPSKSSVAVEGSRSVNGPEMAAPNDLPQAREAQIPEEFRQPEILHNDPRHPIGNEIDGGDLEHQPNRTYLEQGTSVSNPSVGRVLSVDDHPPDSRLPGDPIVDRSEGIKEIGPQAQSVRFENEVDLRTAVQRDPPPELSFRGERAPPKRSALVLFGYRHFFISDGLGRHQDWHVASIELAPFRRYFRLNLLTEIGFEGGDAAAKGDRADLFVMEKAGVGVQYPHWVSPFVEFQGGIGAGRIELFERNDLALLASMGLDVGAQWSVVKHVYLLAAVGWIRPYFMGFGKSDETARYYDRATFKVGVGF